MLEPEKKKTDKPFHKANTVEVKFPDGKVRRVNKFEAKALEEKLKTPKFQALYGSGAKKPVSAANASAEVAAVVEEAKKAAAKIVEEAHKAAAKILEDSKKAAK